MPSPSSPSAPSGSSDASRLAASAAPTRATCGVCGRAVHVKDGKLVNHGPDPSGAWHCEGSGSDALYTPAGSEGR